MIVLWIALVIGCGETAYSDSLDGDGDRDGVPTSADCDDEDPLVGRASSWFLDSDGDGFGVLDEQVAACDRPAGYSDSFDDCDDTDAAVNPGAEELCNGVDDDCDGDTDNDPVDQIHGFQDGDEDGYGDLDTPATGCLGEVSSNAWDCDDDDPDVHPGAEEILCNGVDDDCDGEGADAFAVAGGLAWSSIEEALPWAEDGVVSICSGEWTNETDIEGMTLEITSRTGRAEDAVLRGKGGSILTLRGDADVTLSHLSFAGGDSQWGGAVDAQQSSLTVDSCIFEDNIADSGGAIYFSTFSAAEGPWALVVQGSTFRGNAATSIGGAIATWSQREDSRIEVRESSFELNSSGNKGGALVLDGAEWFEVEIAQSTITTGEAHVSGGAVYLNRGALEISGSDVSDNLAVQGGGACLGPLGQLTSVDTSWDRNDGHDVWAGGESWDYNSTDFTCTGSDGCW